MNQTPAPEVNNTHIPQKKPNSLSVAALVCGLVAFLINPIYLVSAAAVILGIIALCTKEQGSKGMAVAGLCCGLVSFVCQLILDIVLSMFTFGLSFCI